MSGNGAPVAAPQSMHEVEQLVIRLYQPGPPQLIHQIESQLQVLQRSPDGWQMGDALLGSSNRNARFFGALTFSVKLNNDGSSLDPATAEAVLARLIHWLVTITLNHEENRIVSKKLCSALTSYFKQSPVPWEQPLRHLILSFQNGTAVSENTVNQSQATVKSQLPSLSHAQIIVLLWFCGILADEMYKVDANASPAHAHLHDIMEVIVPDVSNMMNYAFQQSFVAVDNNVKSEALKSWFTWVNYGQPVWPSHQEALQHLRNLIGVAAQCINVPDVQSAALDIFRDMLEGYSSFFQPEHMYLIGQLISTHVQPVLLLHLQNPEEDAEGMLYGQVVTAFGNANIHQVVEHPEIETGSNEIVRLLFDVLRSPGSPGDQDEISKDTIEFWNSYIEYVITTVASKDPDEQTPWLAHTKAVLAELIDLLLSKMKTPDTATAQEWDDDNRELLKEFRSDASDLLLSIYLFLGQEMSQHVTTFTLQALEAKDWRALEPGLVCLNILADNILEDQSSEDALRAVFSSNLFREVADFRQQIPIQARRTAIDMLGSYGPYIERHVEFLPDAVRFLFTSLQTTLCNTAAKSIASLCSTCRVALTSELDGFLQQYQVFTGGPTSDPYTKDKCIYAIACIIQALQPESAKAQPLLALLENLERDSQAAKDYAAAGEIEMADMMGVTALSCLGSIGKGLQAPDDMPIDLYEDKTPSQPGTPSFWEQPGGQAVQQRIMGCFAVLQVVGNNGEAIEAACQVLRSGFAETEPGPFVMPPSVTVTFLQQCLLNTPQLEYVLSTACLLITQYSRSNSRRIDGDVSAICQHVAGFVQQLGQPSQDPGVAQACIDVIGRLFPYYVHILLDESSPLSHQIGRILDFILHAIDCQDMMPKRSALEFWSKLLKPHVQPVSENVRARTAQVVSAYGPQLAQSLLLQVAGNCLRSELEYLAEPFKAMINNYTAARAWLEGGLFSDAFTQVSQRAGEAEKRRFLQQIMVARGDSRRIKELIKNFFATCRGTVVSY